MSGFEDNGGVDSAFFDSIQGYMENRSDPLLRSAVYNIGYSDEEIERFATELEITGQALQQVAPFVYYGEAASNFRKNARSDRK